MKRRFQVSGFVGLLALAAGVAMGAGWCLWRQMARLERAQEILVAREQEWRGLCQSTVPPTEETAAAIEAELSRGEREWDRLSQRLGLHEQWLPLPEGRAERAFFEIAGFVERMRERARQSGVKLKEGERFGFADYATTAPEESRVAEVHRQRRLAEAVLEALFESRPRELLGCERGRAAEGGDDRWTERRREDEEFEIGRRLSLAEPGVFDATGYRVRFVGRTATLRTLLNRLSGSPLPLAVRTVEVDLVAESEVREGSTVRVGSTWSRFVVGVEWVQPVANAGAPGS